MLTVRGVQPLLILLAVSALTSFAKDINHEDQDLDGMATSHSRRYEDGGGGDRYSAHEDKAGERDDRGYESYHSAEEINRGHHALGKHYGYHSKDDGGNKHHRHNGGHYDEHHEGIEGEKGGNFHEKGHHGKGHSTRGQHEVKKLDEYQKTKEFGDEDYDYDYDKHDDVHHRDLERGKGGYYKGDHRDHGEHEVDHGKTGYYGKGHHYKDQGEHENNNNRGDYYRSDDRHGKISSQNNGRKWEYKGNH